MSPSARSKKLMEEAGFQVDVVEHWNPFVKRRKDLYGFVDLLGVGDAGTLAVQATSYSNVSARVKKITEHANVAAVRKAGWRLEVHGWRKKGREWICRIVDLS
jgi:carbonic anhydrase